EGDAGAEPAAATARAHPGRLAHVDVLPLLSRPWRSQHACALRRPHADAQADLLLEEGSVGALRSRQRSVRAAQPVRRTGPGQADCNTEGRALSIERGARRQGSVRQRATAQWRGWTGRETARQVSRSAGAGSEDPAYNHSRRAAISQADAV